MASHSFYEPTDSFRIEGMHGEIVSRYRPNDLEGSIRRLIDPDASSETIHWGRNYIYKIAFPTSNGELEVAVKQFRNHGVRSRLRRSSGRSKARLSWRAARAFGAAGLSTAEAIMVLESDVADGPSYFVTRFLPGMIEARYLLRAVNSNRAAEEFPNVDLESFFHALGTQIRQVHRNGFFHRDLSIGNVLFPCPGDSDGNRARSRPHILSSRELVLVDLNRSRRANRIGLWDRSRDLCRMTIEQPGYRRALLVAYWGGERELSPVRLGLYTVLFHTFHSRIAFKNAMRKQFSGLKHWLKPRRAHVHIPDAPETASKRDKIVWDHLSDQPHQHATRFEKLAVRATDLPAHIRQAATCVANAPRILRRYRQLRSRIGHEPVAWPGTGICVRPNGDPSELIEALSELEAQRVLLRIHTWDDRRREEANFAHELRSKGFDLVFVLAQDRSMVADRGRWRRAIAECAELLTPYGKHFQIGQAINRSKWGIWRYSEYLELAADAAEILRAYPGVEILGPAVIDFEPHVTAAVVNLKGARFGFDALATLLYVDRRGAPENTQLGFDTVGKAVLMKAIADTSPWCGARAWITEVNWPLWEGPHSPAGRSVAVDEEAQASYLVRYFLLTLTCGMVERVYWWQLVAKGYGLIDPTGFRRRPSYVAMAVLERVLQGSTFLGNEATKRGHYVLRFENREGHELLACWTTAEAQRIELSRAPRRIIEIDGSSSSSTTGKEAEIEIHSTVRYVDLGPFEHPAASDDSGLHSM